MSPNTQRTLAVLLVVAGAASLVASGVLGVGREPGSSGGMDFNVMYAAGRTWRQGGNPYDQKQLAPHLAEASGGRDPARAAEPIEAEFDAPFSYPPQSAALFVPLAFLSVPAAKAAWLVLNVLSAVAVAVMTVLEIRRRTAAPSPADGRRGGEWDVLGAGVLTAYILGSPLTTNVLWLGQTSLVVFAATMAGWVFSRNGRWLLAGVCMGLATVKPQICLLVFVWLLLERQWKVLLTSAVTAAALGLYPMLLQGPVGVARAWLTRIGSHKTFGANEPGAEFVIDLQSLLHTAGLPVPSLEVVGVILVVVLWLLRDRGDRDDVFGILMGLMVTFVFVHDCEYVCLAPLLTSLWVRARQRPGLLPWVGLLVFLLLFPRRWVRDWAADWNLEVLNHWRTVVVLVMLGVVLALAVRRRVRTGPRPAAPVGAGV
jgi:hypothetical protein